MNWDMFTFRGHPVPRDLQAAREIAASSGFFSDEEIDVLGELVRETLKKGDASGYRFLFLAPRKTSVPVGFSCFGPIPCTRDSYHLYWIAVHAKQRGQGLGRVIIRETEERIRAAGGARIFAETSGRAQYQATRSFYRSAGYRQAARLEDYYQNGEDMIIYTIQLPETRASTREDSKSASSRRSRNDQGINA